MKGDNFGVGNILENKLIPVVSKSIRTDVGGFPIATTLSEISGKNLSHVFRYLQAMRTQKHGTIR